MGQEVHRISRLAARQHGVVTVAQLLRAGFTHSSVSRWCKKGLLHREYRGVYRLGHRAPSAEARFMAAVLACGPGAALSGLAAGFHYDLLRDEPSLPEVTGPSHRRIPGIAACRRRAVPSRVWRGIPTTTLPRTIADLASRLSLDDLARACHEADVRYGVTKLAIPPYTRNAAGLVAIYEGDHALLLSRLEQHFRKLLEAHALPLPVTNRRRGDHYVDCRWAGHPLTVELDSFRYHRSRHAWEADRDRERAARARGDEFRRYTWRDVVEDPQPTIADLRRLLGFSSAIAARNPVEPYQYTRLART